LIPGISPKAPQADLFRVSLVVNEFQLKNKGIKEQRAAGENDISQSSFLKRV